MSHPTELFAEPSPSKHPVSRTQMFSAVFFLFFLSPWMVENAYSQLEVSFSESNQLWTRDNAYFVNNNQYDLSSGQRQIMAKFSENLWGGYWNLRNQPGATYPSIVYGQWPWSTSVTANSGMPVKVQDAGNYFMRWSFLKVIPDDGEFNAPIEIWLHNSPNVRQGFGFDINITCDIMIEPETNSPSGVKVDTVTFDNVSYEVWLQKQDNIELFYPIVHFKRSQRQSDSGRIRLNHFWDYCIAKGLASNQDWISSINAGLEPLSYEGKLSSMGGFLTTSFHVQRERYECEGMNHRSAGEAWELHEAPVPGSSGQRLHDMGADSAGDFVEFDLYVYKSGHYQVLSRVHEGPLRGCFQLSIDGRPNGSVFDTYQPRWGFAPEIEHGTAFLHKGMHRFRYTSRGKNPESSGYEGAFDYLRLIAREAPPVVTGRFRQPR